MENIVIIGCIWIVGCIWTVVVICPGIYQNRNDE